jgi:type IV secretory pathway VirB3-like protein
MNESDLSTFCEPVYKGFIDPSTVLGVPMIPFLLVTTVVFELALLGFLFFGPAALLFVAIIYLYTLMWARGIGANDIQRLRQVMLRSQIRRGQGLSRLHWGAVSFGPSTRRSLQ